MAKNSSSVASSVSIVGLVVSSAMKKSVIVGTEVKVRYPRYGKIMNLSKKYCVHDELSVSKIGDMVEIRQCRPLSKTKTWVLERVLRSGKP
ncbi:30S ribosomal subunit protein S17 [Gammaproteobacteria bacterium]